MLFVNHDTIGIRHSATWDYTEKTQITNILFLFILIKVKSESEVAQSCPTLCDPWTVAHQAPLFMGFPRQEDRSRLPLSTPTGLFDQGSNPCF